MSRDERKRLLTAFLISIGFYLLLFLLLLGIGPISGGPAVTSGGTALEVQLEPIGPAVAAPGEATQGARAAGSATGSRAPAAAQSPQGSTGQTAPANPFALPPGIDLSGQVVAASSGALEAGQVSASVPASSGSAANAGSQGSSGGPTASSPQPGGSPSQPETVIGPGFGAGGFGSESGASFGAAAAAPRGASGGAAAAAAGTSAGSSSSGQSLQNLNVFQQSVLAQVLGQQAAGYAGGGGAGAGASGAAAKAGGAGSGPGAEGGGQASTGAASGGSAAGYGAGSSAASGPSPYPISWGATGKRQIAYEPPPPDLSAYANELPPRSVVRVRFEVAPGGYVTPLNLVGSSGNTIVDNLLLGWMGRWEFRPVSPTIPDAEGSLEYVIQANTAR